MAIACCHASNLTFIASYIIITVKAIDIANKSELIQNFNATAVANETTTAECTDGIHQLHKAQAISILPVFIFIKIHFKRTVTTNATAGTKIRF
jgi:hypothetical protein